MPYNPITNHPSSNVAEFAKDKLYFIWTSQDLTQRNSQSQDSHYFTIDNSLVYIPFFADFGPSNMAHVYRFCAMLDAKLRDPGLQSKKICLFSSTDPDKRANSAFLMCAYMMIMQRKSPEEAHKPLNGVSPPFLPFRDAGHGPATYYITIMDCLKGLHKAMSVGLFDFGKFNLTEYEFHEKVENGDFNWITDKFIAFASPQDEYALKHNSPNSFNPQVFMQRQPHFGVNEMIKYFKEHNVSTVIRLNNKLYDRKKFLDAGIEHIEMYFTDGSNPPENILKKFLEICETRDGVIAVHCKAGLGRTGTLIAAYLMKHYKFTASEVIGFLRVIRPGSVVGPQQNYLHSNQARFWKMGALQSVSVASPTTVSQQSDEMEIDTKDEYMIPAQPRKGLEDQQEEALKAQEREKYKNRGDYASVVATATTTGPRYNLRNYTAAGSDQPNSLANPNSTTMGQLLREKRPVSGKLRSGSTNTDDSTAGGRKKQATAVGMAEKKQGFGV